MTRTSSRDATSLRPAGPQPQATHPAPAKSLATCPATPSSRKAILTRRAILTVVFIRQNRTKRRSRTLFSRRAGQAGPAGGGVAGAVGLQTAWAVGSAAAGGGA